MSIAVRYPLTMKEVFDPVMDRVLFFVLKNGPFYSQPCKHSAIEVLPECDMCSFMARNQHPIIQRNPKHPSNIDVEFKILTCRFGRLEGIARGILSNMETFCTSILNVLDAKKVCLNTALSTGLCYLSIHTSRILALEESLLPIWNTSNNLLLIISGVVSLRGQIFFF